MGGGGRSLQAQQIASAPVPLPAPPVTQTGREVIDVQKEMAQDNLKKKTVRKTVLAGDTGGFNPAADNNPSLIRPPYVKGRF